MKKKDVFIYAIFILLCILGVLFVLFSLKYFIDKAGLIGIAIASIVGLAVLLKVIDLIVYKIIEDDSKRKEDWQ